MCARVKDEDAIDLRLAAEARIQIVQQVHAGRRRAREETKSRDIPRIHRFANLSQGNLSCGWSCIGNRLQMSGSGNAASQGHMPRALQHQDAGAYAVFLGDCRSRLETS